VKTLTSLAAVAGLALLSLLPPTPAAGREPQHLIAFVRYHGDDSEIQAMRPDGTYVGRIVRRSFGVQSPDWSPGGRRLAFVDSKHGSPAIYSIGADGRDRRRLVYASTGFGEPAWSPNGRSLAYTSGRKIVVARSDGTRPRVIARGGVEVHGPHWSPDSRRIVFSVAASDFDDDLFVVEVATRRVVRLTSGPKGDIDPSWSPDGRTIAYIRRGVTEMMGALQVIRADGTGRRTLLRESEYASPAWSPDGRRLAVVGGHESAAEIYTIARNGDDLRRVTKNAFADLEPDWRPSPR
jgi:Tol biopolymer transport system component